MPGFEPLSSDDSPHLTSSPSVPITSIPINLRPKQSKSTLRLLAFNIWFFFSIFTLHVTQLILVPALLFGPGLKHLFYKVNTLAKGTFAIVLVLATQFFGPTTLVITTDHGFDLDPLIQTDPQGRLISIDLPKKSVIMSNHQVYADWLYIWCLAYLAQLHGSIIIILKASLKWVPLVGPAMQMFDFIFLDRSWSSDKAYLTQKLGDMADQVARQQPKRGQHLDRLALLIFPEGTLVSRLTRPISKKYADKMGYEDLKHCLLPRSTGSLFCIRALHRKIPDLQLVDLTIAYPGIPSTGYGQDYYTLQSIFGYGHPPPQVHIHLRIIPVSKIPIGTSHLMATDDDDSKPSDAVDPTPKESAEFDQWLRDQWIRKDQMLARFYSKGTMCDTEQDSTENHVLRRLETKIELRMAWDGIRTALLQIPGICAILASWAYVLQISNIF